MRDHLGYKCRWALDLWTTPATIAAFRQYAELHQRLVPYLYGLAVDASMRGFPLMRPVALISPDDPRAYEDEFTYLLGGDLLVAPVMEPGARQRRLFVPEGEWIDWWEGKRYRGPAVITVAAPQDRIPLLVRTGAILPLAPPSGSLTRASQSRDSGVPLILRVYPASDAVAWRRLTLFDGVEVTVRRTATTRLAVDLTGAPSRRTLLLVLVGEPEPPVSVCAHGGSPTSVGSGGQDGGDGLAGWRHDPQTAETTIAVPGTVNGLEVHASIGPPTQVRRGEWDLC
jgi:alpha-glucosidase (family GH31 glycosyl hydrolase)